MIYAVDNYMDTLKEITERPKPDGFPPRKTYFDTEAEAKKFIIKRAFEELHKLDKQLKNAERRVTKCERKFGFRL